MIDMKTAVQKARDYVADFYTKESIRGLLLEEVEYLEQESIWYVTYSFYIKNSEPKESKDSISGSALMALTNGYASLYKHLYKVLAINAADGSLLSMKILVNNEK